MARLLPLIAIAIGIYFWLKSRRKATGGGASAGALKPGLLPAKQLNKDYASPPRPELVRALAAVRGGDWQQAAELLAVTGTDWERRSTYAYSLSELAAKDDAWLSAWEKARPDDADAAIVRARSTVNLAWDQRGSARAKHTSQKQFEGFHGTLVRSRDEIARAAALNPEDPTPYITEIWTALGLGYPRQDMEALWEEITTRAPHHYEAHFSALQYWCAKWCGSDELAHDFAARAAAGAAPGTLMTAFPLIAWYEAHLDGAEASEYHSPDLTALVDAALTDAAAGSTDHPRLAEVRHLLAYFLVKQERYDAALEQFLLVDGYVEALPWRYNADMRGAYVAARDKAVAKATRVA